MWRTATRLDTAALKQQLILMRHSLEDRRGGYLDLSNPNYCWTKLVIHMILGSFKQKELSLEGGEVSKCHLLFVLWLDSDFSNLKIATPCKYPLLTSPGRTEKIPWWDVRSMIRGHLGGNLKIFYFRPRK